MHTVVMYVEDKTPNRIEVALKLRADLYNLAISHKNVIIASPNTWAPIDGEILHSMMELWVSLGTILQIGRNNMRMSTLTVENDPYWSVNKNVNKLANEILIFGNNWLWPMWEAAFDYTEIALKTIRLANFEKISSSQCNEIQKWIIRQLIYCDANEETRALGIAEVMAWGDMLGGVENNNFPEQEESLVYWYITRLFGAQIASAHKALHGDTWFEWGKKLSSKSKSINIEPFLQLLEEKESSTPHKISLSNIEM